MASLYRALKHVEQRADHHLILRDRRRAEMGDGTEAEPVFHRNSVNAVAETPAQAADRDARDAAELARRLAKWAAGGFRWGGGE